MEDFLNVLNEQDGQFWDEFLRKAKEIHEKKFTLKTCTWDKMSVFQIYQNGWHTKYKEKAIAKKG